MTAENNKWWTLLAVCIATFMLLLDVTIVNVALTSIQRDLHSSFSDLQWVVDAYALTLASFLLTWGSVADILGRRLIFLIGIAIFSAASLSCALAVNPMMLNISRGFQGAGGAAMFATSLALLAQEFTGKDRATAFGTWGAVVGGAVAVGPVVGGALTDGFGWASIFFVNVPVGLLAIALTLWKVRDMHEGRPGVRIDWIGFATFSSALFLLILGLVRGNIDGWGSTKIVTCFVLSALLLIAFVVSQVKQKNPMLELPLFKKPTFDGAAVAAVTLSASIFAMFLYITLYLQNVLRFSPLGTGVRFLPTTVLAFVVAGAFGKISKYASIKVLMGAGLALVCIGLALMAVMVHSDSQWTVLMVGLCVCGVGIGLTNPSIATTAVGVVPPQRSGMASGINSTFRQIGIATGIAGLGAIFQHQVAQGVTTRLAGTFEPEDVKRIAHSVTNGTVNNVLQTVPVNARAVALTAVRDSFVHSLDVICAVAAVIALVGSVTVLLTVHKRDFVGPPQGH